MTVQKYFDGSSLTLLKRSIPLIFSFLSTTAMLFVDRLFLAHYSLEALGAAVNAGTIAWGFAFGFQIITEMSQVVVAQYNGAGQTKRLTHPTWQALWLSLGSLGLFLPLCLWGGALFFAPGSLQADYFRYLVAFGPAFALIGAGSSFFLGTGRNRVVTWAALAGNLVNLVLDWILIFGVAGILEPMGIQGAALATGIGMSVQGLLLLFLFLRASRDSFCPPSWKELKPCLKVGLPPGLFMGVELVGWGIFYSMMAKASSEHILITGICQSLLPLLACVGIGLQKSVASIGGNLIGADEMDQIPGLLFAAFKILVSYIFALGAIMALFPDPVIALFAGVKGGAAELIAAGELHETLKIGLILSCAYLLFGGLRCLVSGSLSAAGDTWFMMIAGSLSVWLLLLGPTYYVVLCLGASVTVAQGLMVLYGFLAAAIYALRFYAGAWKKNSLLIERA